MSGVCEPEDSRTTSMYLGGNSFIMTPPFSPSAICVTKGGIDFLQDRHGRALRFVIGLHLGHELGIAALCFDDGDNFGGFARGVLAHEAMGKMFSLRYALPSGCSTVCSCTSTQS